MDVKGPVNKTIKGNRFLITFVDLASRWVEAFALRDHSSLYGNRPNRCGLLRKAKLVPTGQIHLLCPMGNQTYAHTTVLRTKQHFCCRMLCLLWQKTQPQWHVESRREDFQCTHLYPEVDTSDQSSTAISMHQHQRLENPQKVEKGKGINLLETGMLFMTL